MLISKPTPGECHTSTIIARSDRYVQSRSSRLGHCMQVRELKVGRSLFDTWTPSRREGLMPSVTIEDASSQTLVCTSAMFCRIDKPVVVILYAQRHSVCRLDLVSLWNGILMLLQSPSMRIHKSQATLAKDCPTQPPLPVNILRAESEFSQKRRSSS
jgi:hypothetical protein